MRPIEIDQQVLACHEDRKSSGVLSFSEIFQVTGPLRRLAAMVAGQGYLVAMPAGPQEER